MGMPYSIGRAYRLVHCVYGQAIQYSSIGRAYRLVHSVYGQAIRNREGINIRPVHRVYQRAYNAVCIGRSQL